jgi:uncharacterized protein (TIGR02145 family)
MKFKSIFLLTSIFLISLSSCNPNEDDDTSNSGGNNNQGNNGNTSGTPHTCGAPNVHNPTLSYGTMTDQEGNTYKTIVIGTQEWMAENLNTSIYRNGDAIPTNLDNNEWSSTTSGAYTLNNDGAIDPGYSDFQDEMIENYECPFGKLYNWYACVDERELCPTGWHVPSDEEWGTMLNYLDPFADDGNNPNSDAGLKLKSTGTLELTNGLTFAGTGYWKDAAAGPYLEATNSSGFSALPGGIRGSNSDFVEFWTADGQEGYWWSSSGTPELGSAISYNLSWASNWARRLYFNGGSGWNNGYSVRCLRD